MARCNGKLDQRSRKEKSTPNASKEVIKFSYQHTIKLEQGQYDENNQDNQLEAKALLPPGFWQALRARISRLNQPMEGKFALQVEITLEDEGGQHDQEFKH